MAQFVPAQNAPLSTSPFNDAGFSSAPTATGPLSQAPPLPVSSVATSGGVCPDLDDLDLTGVYPVGDTDELRRMAAVLGAGSAPWRTPRG